MIAVDISGGLGNQMFQYAIGRSLATRTGEDLLLNISYFDRQIEGHTARQYELPFLFQTSAKTKHLDHVITQFRDRKLYKYHLLRTRLQKFDERTPFRYDSTFENLQGPIRLIGYWQCERYFRDIESTIRGDFTFQHISPENREMGEEVRGNNSVSIHIRRTDYLVQGRNWICDLDYIHRALHKLCSMIGQEFTCYIFSDDLDWVKASFPRQFKTVIVDWNTGRDAGYDMWLMSQCRHHIISNSTFSWWGAWLDDSEDKIVIGPHKWTHDFENVEVLLPDWHAV